MVPLKHQHPKQISIKTIHAQFLPQPLLLIALK